MRIKVRNLRTVEMQLVLILLLTDLPFEFECSTLVTSTVVTAVWKRIVLCGDCGWDQITLSFGVQRCVSQRVLGQPSVWKRANKQSLYVTDSWSGFFC